MNPTPAAPRLRLWIILIAALILLTPVVRATAQSGDNTLYLPVVGKSQIQPVTAVLKWAYGGCYSCSILLRARSRQRRRWSISRVCYWTRRQA